LSNNKSTPALALLKKHPAYIDWNWLSCNSNDWALDLLENNLDKIHWFWLSSNSNPRALQLFCKYKEKQANISWAFLATNPALFTLNYQQMSKERMRIIEQELFAKALHPSRVSQWLDAFLATGGNIWDFIY
jgi:hypothetical protein